jgi:hypothetical protein
MKRRRHHSGDSSSPIRRVRFAEPEIIIDRVETVSPPNPSTVQSVVEALVSFWSGSKQTDTVDESMYQSLTDNVCTMHADTERVSEWLENEENERVVIIAPPQHPSDRWGTTFWCTTRTWLKSQMKNMNNMNKVVVLRFNPNDRQGIQFSNVDVLYAVNRTNVRIFQVRVDSSGMYRLRGIVKRPDNEEVNDLNGLIDGLELGLTN